MAMKIANVWVKHCYIAEYLPQVHHFSRQNSQTVHVNDEDSSRFFLKLPFPSDTFTTNPFLSPQQFTIAFPCIGRDLLAEASPGG